MVHVRVDHFTAGDLGFLARICAIPRGSFVQIFTAARRLLSVCLLATLPTYLTHTVECPYLHSQFQRHDVYLPHDAIILPNLTAGKPQS